MCGIAGFIDGSAVRSNDADAIAGKMTGSVRHRGPDDAGVWIDREAGAALGHRRLSIVDLSAAGHQPMVSHDGRYVITYNGEVYGYAALRAELQSRGVSFTGHSDTEVLIGAKGRLALPGQSVNDDFPNLVERMQFIDLVSYLPESISMGAEITSTCFGIS